MSSFMLDNTEYDNVGGVCAMVGIMPVSRMQVGGIK